MSPTLLAHPMRGLPVAVVDVETTGLGEDARVVEIAVVVIDALGVSEPRVAMDTLVNPGRPIPAETTAIHGIGDADVVDAPSFADILPALQAELGERAVAAYSAPYDHGRLAHECARIGAPAPAWPWLDPLVWVKIVDKYEAGKKLAEVARRRGVLLDAHGAVGDARVTAGLLPALLAELVTKGPTRRDGSRSGPNYASRGDTASLAAFLAWQRRRALAVETDDAQYLAKRGKAPEWRWHALENEPPPTVRRPEPGVSRCVGCGAAIVWMVTQSGLQVPLEAAEIDVVSLADGGRHPDIGGRERPAGVQWVAGWAEGSVEEVRGYAIPADLHPEIARTRIRASHSALCPAAARRRVA